MSLFKKTKQDTSINNEKEYNRNYILATEYLEILAKKYDQSISSVADYLLMIDPFESLRNFYSLTNSEFIFLEDSSSYQSMQVMRFLEDAVSHASHNYTLAVDTNMKEAYKKIYVKRSDVENITINQLVLANFKEIPANGSLASRLSFFNVPQVAALFLGIALEDVYITDTHYAYYSHKDKYPDDYYKKYMQTIDCIATDFINENIVDKKFVNNSKINDSLDLTQAVIGRNTLERYLAYKNYSLNNLLKNQPSLLKELEENHSLQVELNDANKQISRLKNEISKLKIDLERKNETPNIKEGQGDSLLILGAVMECIKDVAKSNYTQKYLIDVITNKYKNTKSLSEGTLNKKFPAAKKYLKQELTP